MAKLEFFYDCSSPWTYLAFTRLLPLAEALGVDIEFRPILVGGVFNTVNKEVYATREALFTSDGPRTHYYVKDLQDWAQLCGITLQWPEAHPISSVKAMRGCYYAMEEDCLVPYSLAVFRTYWGGETPDIASDEVLGSICREVGLDEERFFCRHQ